MFEADININELENQELLLGFKGEGISVETIGNHLFKTGVLVRLNIGRMRLEYSYDFKGLGIDFTKTNSNDFVQGHMKSGKISILPIHIEKSLSKIESSLRNKQKGLAIGFNGQFMPLNSYMEFKKEFEGAREEYLMVRDEILEKWNIYVEDYKARLSILLKDLNAIERDHLYQVMIGNIPTKENYKNSFKMFMSVSTMPQIDKNNDLDNEINKIISQDIVGVIYETVQGCLLKACTLANSAIKAYKKGDISVRTVGAIRTISKTLRARNVAANNPKIDEIADLFDEATGCNSRDDMASIMEIILAKSYIYAIKNNIPLCIEPVLPVHDLERICSYA